MKKYEPDGKCGIEMVQMNHRDSDRCRETEMVEVAVIGLDYVVLG